MCDSIMMTLFLSQGIGNSVGNRYLVIDLLDLVDEKYRNVGILRKVLHAAGKATIQTTSSIMFSSKQRL